MPTMSANLEAFLRSRRAKQLSPATLEWYEWLLFDYCEYVETQGLRWDDPDALDIFFRDHLPTQKLSAHTVHSYYRALRCFFNWMEKRRRLPGDNPIRMIEPPRLPRRYPRGIEAGDVEKLLATISAATRLDRCDRAIILFLWDTGVRADELCKLEMRDLDLEQQRALIRDGKGEKDRYVSFGLRAKELLLVWLEVRAEKAKCDYVFLNRSGKPFARRGVRTMLRQRQIEVKVDGPCNPHAFRHGFAMTFLDNGGNIYNLQHLMGHASLC